MALGVINRQSLSSFVGAPHLVIFGVVFAAVEPMVDDCIEKCCHQRRFCILVIRNNKGGYHRDRRGVAFLKLVEQSILNERNEIGMHELIPECIEMNNL